MSKFFVECPACQRMHEASTGLFAKRTIKCPCGRMTDVRSRRMTTCACPSCGNHVIYDKARGKNAKCPVCKAALVTEETLRRVFDMLCPSCSCSLHVDKNAESYTCPVCETKIDVQRERILIEQRKRDKLLSLAYQGQANTLVWKHPVTNFLSGTQLTVREGQEAIFLRNGAALDSFIAGGPYKLDTGNLPQLTRAMEKTMDGNPFEAEVVFVNLAVVTDVKWGVGTKIRVTDPKSNIPFDLGAHGMFNLRVDNARKLLFKLSAANNADILTVDDLFGVDNGMLRNMFLGDVKTYLPHIINEHKISVVDLNQMMFAINARLEETLNKTLAEYGLVLNNLRVNLLLPEQDADFKRLLQQRSESHILVEQERIRTEIALAERARKNVEEETNLDLELMRARKEAEIARIRAQADADAYSMKAAAEANEMRMKGYTYKDETARMTSMAAMENQGSAASPFVSASIGTMTDAMQIGTQIGVIKEAIRTTQEAMNPVAAPAQPAAQQPAADSWECPKCHTSVVGNFCSGCGEKRPTAWTCPTCGQSVMGNFCSGCGAKRPAPAWTCPTCGTTGISGNFCSSCGTKRPDSLG